jgi:putative two-component system response regulator
VLELSAEIARSHHEHWDGGGYPHGIAGEEIPLAGRLSAVADVFDALTHARPYKPAWAVGEAVAEMQRLRGTQFDPEVLDAFSSIDHRALLEPVVAATA